MTSSTVSRESAPKSSMNLASGVTWSALTPNCSTMISLTRCSIDFSAMIDSGSNFCCVSMPRDPRRQAPNLIFVKIQNGLAASQNLNRKMAREQAKLRAFSRTRTLRHHHAAVHGQNLAGDVASGGAGGKEGGGCDVLRRAKAA